jgi:hypothetical protein
MNGCNHTIYCLYDNGVYNIIIYIHSCGESPTAGHDARGHAGFVHRT